MSVRITSLSNEIINQVLSEIDLVAWALSRPANFRYEYIRGGLTSRQWEKINNDRRKRRAVHEMRCKKKLTDQKKGNQVIIKIDRDTIAAQLKERILSIDKKLPDGKLCLISFDFPTGANNARSAWRRCLLSIGCRREHLSLWSSRKAITDGLVALTRVLDVGDWVKIYSAVEDSR